MWINQVRSSSQRSGLLMTNPAIDTGDVMAGSFALAPCLSPVRKLVNWRAGEGAVTGGLARSTSGLMSLR